MKSVSDCLECASIDKLSLIYKILILYRVYIGVLKFI